MTGIRRDIRTSESVWHGLTSRLPDAIRLDRRGRLSLREPSNFLQRGLGGRLQQFLGISLWITVAEHRVACHQNFCSRPDHFGHGVERDAAIDFNAEIQAAR